MRLSDYLRNYFFTFFVYSAFVTKGCISSKEMNFFEKINFCKTTFFQKISAFTNIFLLRQCQESGLCANG